MKPELPAEPNTVSFPGDDQASISEVGGKGYSLMRMAARPTALQKVQHSFG